MEKRKSIQVDEVTWERLKVVSLRDRVPVGVVVQRLALNAAGPDTRQTVSRKATSATVPAVATGGVSEAGQRALERVAKMTALWSTVEPAPVSDIPGEKYLGTVRALHDEDRCVCGQRWRDHQSGDSGKLAVVSNCRNFRVTE